METKYKGYEELLDVDEDDPDIVIPCDVQGSVRALNYALAHPLIFSESHGTYKERRVKKEKVIYMLILWYKHLGKANSEAPPYSAWSGLWITGCPKSSLLYVISLYFSSIGLGKQII